MVWEGGQLTIQPIPWIRQCTLKQMKRMVFFQNWAFYSAENGVRAFIFTSSGINYSCKSTDVDIDYVSSTDDLDQAIVKVKLFLGIGLVWS